MTRLEIARDSLPHLQAQRSRRIHRIDTEQTHAAQDEWHYGCFQLGTAGQSDAGDVAPEAHGAREPGEQLAADVVDGAGELRFFHRPRTEIDPISRQHASGT